MQLWFQEAAARDEAQWRARQKSIALRPAGKLPGSFQKHIATGWDDRYGTPISEVNGSPVALANTFAQDAIKEFGNARCSKAHAEELIRDHADNYATLCGRMGSLESCRLFGSEWFGIEPTRTKKTTPASERARWNSEKWWRAQLRKVWTRATDDALRAAGCVRKGRAAYVSDEAVEQYLARQRRTLEWLESSAMVNEEGEELSLLDLHNKSVANKGIRRGEMMARIRGFEEYGEKHGSTALFLTLTTPSRFHAQLSTGGVNPNWQEHRHTVRDGQKWLCGMWDKVRAKLARLSIMYYGFRIAEPHHDGTPHWHALIFVAPHQAATLEFVVRQYWLSDAGTEPGAQLRRFKCDEIDKSKGSAVGYIAKYIAKNIDAFGAVGDAVSDETGKPINESVMRIPAWASVHGIKQFTQVGGPAVGVYRELRRQRTPFESLLLESVRAPADAGKVCDYIEAQGGIERARRRIVSTRSKYSREVKGSRVRVRRLAVKQWRDKCGPRVAWTMRPARPDELPPVFLDRAEARAIDTAGREVVAFNRYGEEAGFRPAGVCSFGLMGRYQSADTRLHRWRIQKCQKSSQEKKRQSESGDYSPLPNYRGTISGPHSMGKDQSEGLSSSPRCSKSDGSHATRAQRLSKSSYSSATASSWSDSFPALGSRSDLGPVAITVRGPDRSAGIDFAWVATVPYRTMGDPKGWTGRETSMAGPHVH